MEFLAASMLPPSLTMKTPARAFTSWSCVSSCPRTAEAARATSITPNLHRATHVAHITRGKDSSALCTCTPTGVYKCFGGRPLVHRTMETEEQCPSPSKRLERHRTRHVAHVNVPCVRAELTVPDFLSLQMCKEHENDITQPTG